MNQTISDDPKRYFSDLWGIESETKISPLSSGRRGETTWRAARYIYTPFIIDIVKNSGYFGYFSETDRLASERNK
jgi:hypothetical protein